LASSWVVLALALTSAKLIPRSANAVTTVGKGFGRGRSRPSQPVPWRRVGVEQGGGDDAAPGVVGTDKLPSAT
jgi:hypothetical protein